MTLYTVTITGVSPSPEVYGGLVAATAYIGAMIGDAYTAWRALDTDDQGRTLVAATRYLDAFQWQGEPSYAGGTTLQWPRTGVIGPSGDELTEAEQLDIVSRATFELAAIAADDPDVFAALDASGNIRSVSAGGAGVEFFNPTSPQDGSATTFPVIVQRLIGRYLATSVASSAPGAYGQSGLCGSQSTFGRCNDFGRTEPY